MRHIGNVHTNLPQSLACGADGECIVKVLGIVRVDGTGEHIAHVEAAGYLIGRDSIADMVGCLLYGNGIFVGETKLGEDGMHLCIIIACLA